jgi:long-subunit fatty acid transport protein
MQPMGLAAAPRDAPGRRRRRGRVGPCGPRRGAALVALVMTLAAGVGRAQPMTTPWVGGIAFSGPASSDLTSAYYNPAALGLRGGTSFQLGFTGAASAFDIDRAAIDPATGARAPAGLAGARTFAGVRERVFAPSGFAGLASDLGTDNITLSVAAYTPYVERRAPGSAQATPGQDGPTRYHLIEQTLYHVFLTPAVTFRIADFLYVGVGLDIIFSELGSFTVDRDTALAGAVCSVAANGVESDGCAQRIRTTGSNVSVSVPVGVLIRPTNRLDIGLSYRTGAFGTSRDNVPLVGSGTLTQPGQTTGQSLFARTTLHLPHTFLAGAELRFMAHWDLGLTLRWLHWAGEEVQDIRLSTAATDERNVPARIPLYRGYRDSLLTRAIASYRYGPWRFGAGALISTPSVDAAALSPATVDGWQLGAVLLVEAQVTRWLAVTAGYGLRGIIPRSVSASAFDPLYQLDCVQSRYDVPTCRLANRGRGVPTAAGDYGTYTHDFAATALVQF